jgi:uncharacterized repeat protein (TIGR01451 family)
LRRSLFFLNSKLLLLIFINLVNQMKPINIIRLGAIALLSSVSFAAVMPSLASLQNRNSAIAQTAKQEAPVQLKLAAERKSTIATASGRTNWKPLPQNASLHPGENIRYVVTASNVSDRLIKKLVVKQPIPKGSVYVLGSATLPKVNGAKLDYSIDGGKTYSEKPSIQVKLETGKSVTRPAPDSMYTNVRWSFGDNFSAKTVAYASYQVRIR